MKEESYLKIQMHKLVSFLTIVFYTKWIVRFLYKTLCDYGLDVLIDMICYICQAFISINNFYYGRHTYNMLQNRSTAKALENCVCEPCIM